MAASATNIANSGITSLAGPVGYTQTQPYLLLTHIRIVNKTAGTVNVSLWIGATGGSAAGTEFAFSAFGITANGFQDWYGRVRLESTDFLTGLASAATSLTFEAEGEIGLT
jgi:hypothetical protein